MNVTQLLDLKAIQAEKGKRSLKQFTKDVWHIVEPGTPFVDGWCIDALCLHLEALTFGDLRKLVINIPPRHSKSTIVSVVWPVWDWLHIPGDRFLCASYKFSLAMRDNRRRRNLIADDWFQSRYKAVFTLSEDQRGKGLFENDKKGYQMALSVAGSATGDGGSKLVIDDPHSADDAHSATLREAAVTWFRETWTNRLNDQHKDCMVVVGQRIHDSDVCGYILKERPDWEHLNLPAEYDPTRKCITSIGWEDPRSDEGELLWPERFDKSVLDNLKRDLGPTGFASQYQQRPNPAQGGTFQSQWIRYFSQQDDAYILHTPNGNRSILKAECWRFTVVDLAISSKQSADYTVIQTWDVTPQNDLLLIDQVRGRFDNPTQQRIIKQVYVTLNPRFVKIETTGYQLSLVQQLRDEPTANNEFLVSVGNPDALETTFKQLGWADASLVKHPSGFYKMVQEYYVVRVLGDANFFVFACENQGYCKIIDKSEVSKFSIPIREFRPTRDKVSRASTPAIQMENGKMYFEQGASYVTDLVSEVLIFPKGAHDDQIDCLSQAADEVIQPRGPIMWSVSDGTPPRTLEMAELPENKQYQMVEIERYVSEDEGDYYESEAY